MPFTKIIFAHPQGMPKKGCGMDFYDDPLWEWKKTYLEVDDVRPVGEQGDAEVWGVPEALNLL